jgi:hypothetical protein
MKNICYFGEKKQGYNVRVLNEREIRASAGILFLFAMISFMNAWLNGNFDYIKIFIIAFLLDFFIRIFINPKYAPSLIIGRVFVRNQKVEYVGAPQKKFAWILGFILASTMFYLVVLNDMIGPINLYICLICLTLLFFESAFGICIGCKIYNIFNTEKARLCPGWVCETTQKEEIQTISLFQIAIALLYIIFLIALAAHKITQKETQINTSIKSHTSIDTKNECDVPEWAIKIGHEEQWKLHNGCAE